MGVAQTPDSTAPSRQCFEPLLLEILHQKRANYKCSPMYLFSTLKVCAMSQVTAMTWLKKRSHLTLTPTQLLSFNSARFSAWGLPAVPPPSHRAVPAGHTLQLFHVSHGNSKHRALICPFPSTYSLISFVYQHLTSNS